MEVICLSCENVFESKRPTAKFCSDICRATFSQNKLRVEDGSITIKIYALINPITDTVFYVGKTVGSLDSRLNSHIKDKEGNVKKVAIVKGILAKNQSPKIIELESFKCKTQDEELAALLREDFWIKEYAKKNELCNVQGVKSVLKPRFISAYAKESYKTRPIGVRFEIDKLDFIKGREKIETGQKVIDFLLNKYWWDNRTAVPTHRNAPPLELKEETIQSTQIPEVPDVRQYKSPQEYVLEKRDCDTTEGYQKWFNELESDTYLSKMQKTQIKLS